MARNRWPDELDWTPTVIAQRPQPTGAAGLRLSPSLFACARPPRPGFDNTTGSAVYYVLYVLLLYYVLIQIIHACWQPVALGAPTSTGRRLQQYLLRANSSFLWNQDIIHGILTVSVPILPFWGQDIMA